jgi:hypothetical protein
MNPSTKCGYGTRLLLASMLAGTGILAAADDANTTAVPSNTATLAVSGQTQDDEIARLKAALAEQQKQLQMLQQTLQSQQALLEKAIGSQTTGGGNAGSPSGASSGRFNGIGQVASTAPLIPVAPLVPIAALPAAYPSPAAHPSPAAYPGPLPQGASSSGATGNPCESPEANGPVPAYLRLGSVCIVPIGFMDLTPFWRDKNAASSMGSNFGSVPYNNAAAGNLSEFHFSQQNSRVGFRIDGNWKGAHFIGYNEFDFNGTSGATNLAVSNGAIVPRLRLFWADVRKGKLEYLVGQSWSLMVPNRRGLSALPGDLFYSQVIDINYIAGLTWTRQPGMRVLFHPSNKVTFGLSAEQGDQYMGGSGGGGQVVLPTALAGLVATQLDNGAGFNATPAGSYLGQPTLVPDFIAKLAFDPSSRFHFEVGGITSSFKTASLAAPWTHHTTTGGGVTFGLNAGITNNIRVVASGMLSDGEGRYLFGAAPDLIVRADGSLSAVHADGWISGLEATIKNTLVYGYYSGDYIGRNVALDANGTTKIGYGYTGSANSQNRAIEEITFGFNQTVWRDPRYGAINVMGQYEWLERMPWFVAVGAPKNTHDNTIYFNVRYTLPGAMPNF